MFGGGRDINFRSEKLWGWGIMNFKFSKGEHAYGKLFRFKALNIRY